MYIYNRNKINPKMLFRTALMCDDWKEEGSLENTLNCVPKVQDVLSNLSGKRTEKGSIVRDTSMLFCVSSPLKDCLFILLL